MSSVTTNQSVSSKCSQLLCKYIVIAAIQPVSISSRIKYMFQQLARVKYSHRYEFPTYIWRLTQPFISNVYEIGIIKNLYSNKTYTIRYLMNYKVSTDYERTDYIIFSQFLSSDTSRIYREFIIYAYRKRVLRYSTRCFTHIHMLKTNKKKNKKNTHIACRHIL